VIGFLTTVLALTRAKQCRFAGHSAGTIRG
jgi:hypothetical protein